MMEQTVKVVPRILACTLVIAAAAAGNSLNKAKVSTVIVAGVPGGGPIPMCNPYVQKCPNIR